MRQETKIAWVDLWVFSVDDIALDFAFDLLTPQERYRARSLMSETRRSRFVAAHAGLRLILAEFLNVPPAEVGIVEQPLGKPEVLTEKSLHVSLSYSEDRILVGCSSAELGVDLEVLRDFDWQDVADQFLHSRERQWLRENDAVLDGFFKIWTLKEAYLKGVGTGLSQALDTFVILPDQTCQICDHDKNTYWRVANIQIDDSCIGAIAVAAKAFDVRRRWIGELLPER